MKLCRYCYTMMQSTYETDAHNVHRQKGFHVCPKCQSICDDDITEKKGVRKVHSERWFNGKTKEFE